MPSLGADMEAGTLVEWLVAPGDQVSRGDTVAVVETQKGAIEIEIFEAGEIEALTAKVGDEVPVGAPLARLRGVGTAKPPARGTQASPPPAPRSPEIPAAARPAPVAPAAAGAPVARQSLDEPASAPRGPGPRAGPDASPAARATAAERGIDIGTLSGSGPGGAILLADLEATATSETPRRPATKPGLDPDAMRSAIAAAMSRSKREIPHYYLAQTVDLQPATDWLAAANATRQPETRLLMGALFVKAAAIAARKVPQMNGTHENGTFRPAEAVHLGLAIALRGGGLIAPAIRNADILSLDAVMAAMRDVIERTRTGRLRSSELTDATLTLTSMGERGTESLYGVIYPPQVAIAGFGAPVRRPWIVDGAVMPRTVVTLTLAADHRVSDGRVGARFLAEIERQLQLPEAL